MGLYEACIGLLQGYPPDNYPPGDVLDSVETWDPCAAKDLESQMSGFVCQGLFTVQRFGPKNEVFECIDPAATGF